MNYLTPIIPNSIAITLGSIYLGDLIKLCNYRLRLLLIMLFVV